MYPTSYLRWLSVKEKITVSILLQQWWADNSCDVFIPDNPGGSPGEWRDIPIIQAAQHPLHTDGLDAEEKCMCPSDGVWGLCPIHGTRRR